jgi:hypothetical protein
MSIKRTVVGWVFLISLSLLSILFFTIYRAEALGQPATERFSESTDAVTDSTAVGFVTYDGVPVEGATVHLLRDETVVYTTTTALGAGTVPSFTVTLSDPPINAVTDELLTLEVEFLGDVNRLSFVVARGEQTLTGRLSSTCGETEITDGLIDSDTTWTPECGPYLIRTNLLVMSGATLTMEAGTTVMFDADKAMSVDGRLLTQGAPNALVSFTTGQGMPWGYLSFYGASTGSVLEYTLVEYAGSLSVEPNAAVRVDGVDAEFQGLIVRHSLADGIDVFNDGTASMDNLMVLDNQGCGIYVDSDTAALNITDSLVRGNLASGIHIRGEPSGTITGNTIAGNVGSTGGGVRLHEVTDLTISHNRIVGNRASGSTLSSGGGVYAHSGSVTIDGNFVSGNEASVGGGGIAVVYHAIGRIARNIVVINRTTREDYLAGSGLYISTVYGSHEVANNIFAANVTASGGQGAGAIIAANASVQHNTFVQNFSTAAGGAALYANNNNIVLQANTIVDNVATSSPLGDWGAVQLGKPAILANSNLFDNSSYDLQNSAPLADGTVNAQSNWWGTTDQTEIRAQIYDWNDDATVGVVDYADWLAEPWSVAPVSPPMGLEATVDQSSILLSWSPNPEADVAGYKIYLDTSEFLFDPAVHGSLPGIDVGLNTNFTLACLPPNTYYLAITAYDGDVDGVDDWTDGHESWFSREMEVATTATPVCGPPAAPTTLGAIPIGASQINLSWTDNASEETSYRVERSPDGSTNWTEIASLAANTTTYNNTGLSCNTTYHYRVRAHRAGDDQFSTYSNIVQATTTACPTGLPAPTGLNATTISASHIDLSWTDNASDETSYRVERLPDGSANWTEIASLGASATSYSDTGLDGGVTYHYRVRAYRAGDDLYSAYSNVVQATTDWLLYLPIVHRR